MLLWVSELLSAPDPLCVPGMFAGSLAWWRDRGEDAAPCCFHHPSNPRALPLTPMAFQPPLAGSCRDQEGRRGSEEAVPGPSVFPSGDPGVSGDFWGSYLTGATE